LRRPCNVDRGAPISTNDGYTHNYNKQQLLLQQPERRLLFRLLPFGFFSSAIPRLGVLGP
jgi:hypothetical protein